MERKDEMGPRFSAGGRELDAGCVFCFTTRTQKALALSPVAYRSWTVMLTLPSRQGDGRLRSILSPGPLIADWSKKNRGFGGGQTGYDVGEAESISQGLDDGGWREFFIFFSKH